MFWAGGLYHKPLIPLLGPKNFDSLPPRGLQFCLRLARLDCSIVHVPVKLLYTQRAPVLVASTESSSTSWQVEAELLVEAVIANLPAGIKEYSDAQAADPVCLAVANYCRNGWLTDKKVG